MNAASSASSLKRTYSVQNDKQVPRDERNTRPFIGDVTSAHTRTSTDTGPSHASQDLQEGARVTAATTTDPHLLPPIVNGQALALQSTGPSHAGAVTIPKDVLHRLIELFVPPYHHKDLPVLKPESRRAIVKEACRHYQNLASVNKHWRHCLAPLIDRAWQTYLVTQLEAKQSYYHDNLRLKQVPPLFEELVTLKGIGSRVEALVAKAMQHPDLTLRILNPLMEQVGRLIQCFTNELDAQSPSKPILKERNRLAELPWTILVLAYQNGLTEEKLFDGIVDLVIRHASSLTIPCLMSLWTELQELYSEQPGRLEKILDRHPGNRLMEFKKDTSPRSDQQQTSDPAELPKETDAQRHGRIVQELKNTQAPFPPSFIRALSRITRYWVAPRGPAPQDLEAETLWCMNRWLTELTRYLTPRDRYRVGFLFELFPEPWLTKAVGQLNNNSQTHLLLGLELTVSQLPLVTSYAKDPGVSKANRLTLLSHLLLSPHLHHPDVLEPLRVLWCELTETKPHRF